ncbi:hypothetical protein OAG71_00230 [bacterium]|nr:hypothetical protein [bacterium]
MKRFSFVFLSFVLIATAVSCDFENSSSKLRASRGDASPLAENSDTDPRPESPLQLRAAARKGAEMAVDPNDLSKISREIRVEPEFEGDARHYFLLVFDEDEAKKVWVVFDGKKLYVDRNLNGDLSDEGESFPANNDDEGSRYRKIKDIQFAMPDGDPASLTFTYPDAYYKEFKVRVLVKYRGASFSAWGDQDGDVVDAKLASEAPILRINGPLQMGFEVPAKYGVEALGNNKYEVNVGVGTPGLGKGSFMHLKYDAIPIELYPDVELEFPPKQKGSLPVVVKSKLRERC